MTATTVLPLVYGLLALLSAQIVTPATSSSGIHSSGYVDRGTSNVVAAGVRARVPGQLDVRPGFVADQRRVFRRELLDSWTDCGGYPSSWQQQQARGREGVEQNELAKVTGFACCKEVDPIKAAGLPTNGFDTSHCGARCHAA